MGCDRCADGALPDMDKEGAGRTLAGQQANARASQPTYARRQTQPPTSLSSSHSIHNRRASIFSALAHSSSAHSRIRAARPLPLSALFPFFRHFHLTRRRRFASAGRLPAPVCPSVLRLRAPHVISARRSSGARPRPRGVVARPDPPIGLARAPPRRGGGRRVRPECGPLPAV